jgi:hypothetical protein
MTITAKCIAVVLLLALSPSPSSAASVYHLACNGITTGSTDANEYASLERATLNGNRFSGLVSFGLVPQRSFVAWTPKELQDARRDLVLGFQMDDSVTTGIHTSIANYSVSIDLEFPHLKHGRHRLRVGLMDRRGDLFFDNAYCFSTPGYFVLTQ